MSAYIHVQASPAISWTILHNLNTKPVVDVMVTHNGRLEKILPLSVVILDSNSIQVNFSSLKTGKARLIGS